MGVVYILKVHEPHEYDEIISIHRTFDGASNAWSKKRDEIINYYEMCIEDMKNESKFEEDVCKLEEYISDLRLLTPTTTLSGMIPQQPFITPAEVKE